MPVPRSRSGFTLVELMVALVISGILVTVVFQFLVGQGRFARMQTGREEVQQNARFALDVITSDLRGTGSPGTLLAATSNSITFRRPHVWGVVCSFSSGNLTVLFPDTSIAAFQAQNGVNSLGVQVGTAGAPGLVPVWDFSTGQDNTASQAAAASASCTTDADNSDGRISPDPAIVMPLSGPANSRARSYGNVALDPVPVRGMPAYLHEVVTYRIGASTVPSIPGTWIQRQVGTVTQPLAGPVPSNGVVFTYFDAAGAPVNSPSTQEQRDAIDRISVRVVTHSRAGGTMQQTDTDSTSVYLRN